MTSERKRALITIMATLIIGILIGALGVGLWNKQQGRSGKPSNGGRQHGKEAFVKKVLSVIEADSSQVKQLRPLINETVAQIDSLQKRTDREMKKVIDSFEAKAQPILTEKQMIQLKEFHQRGREKERR
jgi:hypothetical protein